MVNSARTGPSRAGVIDLGSNSALLLVLEEGGRVVLDRARITRLGQGVFSAGRLDPEARRRTLEAIAEFVRAAREAGVARLVCLGTEAMRRAADADRFVEDLCKAGGIDEVRVLTADEEAELSVEALRDASGAGPTLVDVGGGSTEVVQPGAAGVRSWSLPLGSVRLTEELLPRHPIPPRDLARLRQVVEDRLAPLVADGVRAHTLAAVAGTATTLAALELGLRTWDAGRVEGLRLRQGQLARWIERLAALDVEQRRELPGMEPGRADVIVAGLVVLQSVSRALGAHELRVSSRGVRFGAALRLLEGRPLV